VDVDGSSLAVLFPKDLAMSTPKQNADKAKQQMLATPPPRRQPADKDFLSLNLTLLNLECHGRVNGGICKGHIYHVRGRASAGKTMLSLGILAEAAQGESFKDYELIADDVEHATEQMDIPKLFGIKLEQRLLAPGYSKSTRRPIYSHTFGVFIQRIRKKIADGKKVIWLLDSLDALQSEPGTDNAMTDGKAKIYSQELRKLMDPLVESGSILIMTSQARVKMGGSAWDEDIFAGGRALEHYPQLSIELRKAKTLYRSHRGNRYVVGMNVRAMVKKNRISGGVGNPVFFDFYPDYGMDDIGSCIDYLLRVKHWKSEKAEAEDVYDSEYEEDSDKLKARTFNAPEFDFIGKAAELTVAIEREHKQKELSVLVGKVWSDIKKELSNEHRQPRFE
jgi:RecA/RadA recombinase